MLLRRSRVGDQSVVYQWSEKCGDNPVHGGLQPLETASMEVLANEQAHDPGKRLHYLCPEPFVAEVVCWSHNLCCIWVPEAEHVSAVLGT